MIMSCRRIYPYLLFLLCCFSLSAYSDFYTAPNKITLNSQQNITTMYIMNKSNQPRAFILKSIDMKMNAQGNLINSQTH